jgi:DNA-binding NarL/FixJ family response regulator
VERSQGIGRLKQIARPPGCLVAQRRLTASEAAAYWRRDRQPTLTMPYRVLIADDHPLYRDALQLVVAGVFADMECSHGADVAGTLRALDAGDIDLVLLDLSMPDASGLEGLRRIRAAHPTVPVIVCSADDDPRTVREAFQDGAAGYLPKSSGTALTRHALEIVRAGGRYVPSEALREQAASPTGGGTERVAEDPLTPRQVRVLELMEQGLSNKAIGRELGIGEITVKAHVSAILRKLGVDNRVQAVLAARARHGN